MTAGRPRKYESALQMQIAIDEYFQIASDRTKPFVTKDGGVIDIPAPAPIHITGLCLHLGITNETLNQYQLLEEFSEPITRAKQKCEAYTVDQVFEGQKGNKADFVLRNNFGERWKDKSHQDVVTTTKIVYIEKSEKEDYENHIDEITDDSNSTI